MLSCTLDIRKPVFDGLIRERKHGFVHLDWQGIIREGISDTIDFDMDSVPVFYIRINTEGQTTNLNPFNASVKDVSISTQTYYGWAVGVDLEKSD
jgi:hypothetical protein